MFRTENRLQFNPRRVRQHINRALPPCIYPRLVRHHSDPHRMLAIGMQFAKLMLFENIDSSLDIPVAGRETSFSHQRLVVASDASETQLLTLPDSQIKRMSHGGR